MKNEHRYKRILIKIQDGKCDACDGSIIIKTSKLIRRKTPRIGKFLMFQDLSAVHEHECVEETPFKN